MVNQDLRMYDVGNGLHITIGERHPGCSDLIIDYGGQRNLEKSILEGDFILSHFHKDHYNGFTGKRRFTIPHLHLTSFYYPAMPKFEENTNFYFALFAMNSFLSSGVPEPIQYSVLRIVKEYMCGGFKKLKFTPLAKGDKVIVGGKQIEILWPPPEIKDVETIKKIKDAIKNFEEACKIDQRLKEIYSKIKEMPDTDMPKQADQRQKNEFESFSQEGGNEKGMESPKNRLFENWRSVKELVIKSEDKIINENEDSKDFSRKEDIIEKANKSLKSAANDLSLAFRCKNSLLFLGDLEERQIGQVADNLIALGQTDYDIILTAHHGTHWHDSLLNLSANYCLASVGGLYYNLKSGYKKICKKFVNTKDYGNIKL